MCLSVYCEGKDQGEVVQFETCRFYNPVESNCVGLGFVTKIEGNIIELKVSEEVSVEDIVYIAKGDAKCLALNPGQMKRLTNMSDYVENFERENVVRGADYFIKTKRVFK